MSGLFNTFNTAVKGLNAQQTALNTTSHNISNANTEGFSRQRVELKADKAYDYSGIGQLGTGVKIEGVVRVVDDFVDYQIRNENSTLGKYTAKSDAMSQLESIFNEPSDTGVNSAMGEMFNAWQELSDNPESQSAKSVVVEKSETFADALKQLASQIDGLRSDTITDIEKNTFDINSTADKLKTLNSQIYNIVIKGESPNDLLDQRDLLLKQLSGLADCTSSFDKYGRVSVSLGGKDITAQDAAYKLSTVSGMTDNGDGAWAVKIAVGGDTSNIKTVSMTADSAESLKAGSPVYYEEGASEPVTAAPITSGAVGGNLEALSEIEARLSDLDSFAKAMAEEVNSVHNPDGSGADFFTFSGTEGALNINVNPKITDDESLVATGASSAAPSGDGSRALAIANLRSREMANGATLKETYSGIVTKIGISTEHALNVVANQDAVMAQLTNRRESVSGVSIDEEVTNLIKYQKSYEANSKVISVLAEMLDTLINKTGV
jgi:flagellar hook-associated protein 1 FlgK